MADTEDKPAPILVHNDDDGGTIQVRARRGGPPQGVEIRMLVTHVGQRYDVQTAVSAETARALAADILRAAALADDAAFIAATIVGVES